MTLPSPTPSRRSRHCFVAHPNTGDILMFGGIEWHATSRRKDRMLGDTWLLTGDGEWLLLMNGKSPKGRHRSAMVFDSANDHFVMFGGQDDYGIMCPDTWTHNGLRWAKIGKPFFKTWPVRRCGHMMAFDESIRRTILFGGIDYRDRSLDDTWEFDGESWTPVPGMNPGPLRYAAFGYCAELKGCLLHGGSEDDAGRVRFGETWLFRDRKWRYLGAKFETEARDDHSLLTATHDRKCFLFPAVNDDGTVLQLTRGGWKETRMQDISRGLQCSPVIWHDQSNRFKAFGGETCHGGKQSAKLRSIAWAPTDRL